MNVEVYPNTYNVQVYSNASFVPSALPMLVIDADLTASVNKAYVVDTSALTVSVTLPAQANLGDTIELLAIGASALTVDRNGHKINGADLGLTLNNLEAARLRYANATLGWVQF